MSTLIIVEHDNKKISPSFFNLVTTALEFKTDITAVVIGNQCESVAQKAAQVKGLAKVILLNNPCYESLLAENLSLALLSVINRLNCTNILAASSTFGKNLLPRIAAKLNVGQVSDVIQIVDTKTFIRPIYAGNALETIKILDPINVLSIRATAFEVQELSQDEAPIESFNDIFEETNTQLISYETSKSLRPDLGSAKIVVSGGRGLQNAENFKLIEQLADTLGAAIGASRAAVDAGFVSNDFQVGQTGKIVAPALYIAVGISGAIQHLAGMKDAKTIVAINKDPNAPIFQIATYGLVGDLFEIVPKIINQLKNADLYQKDV